MLILIDAGELGEQSLLGQLQPVTPETAEDVEDSQAVEYMTLHGVLGSGTVMTFFYILCYFSIYSHLILD